MIPKFFLSPSGSDANTGMSAASPWRHHPRSRKATGLSAAFGAIWKALGLMVLMLMCVQTQAAIAKVQEKAGTSTSLTLSSNSTIGNTMIFFVSSAANGTGTVKLGTQTASLLGACTSPVVSSLHECAYHIDNITVASTAVTCTTCGTFNYIAAIEWSGTNGSPTIDSISGCAVGSTFSTPCQVSNTGAILGNQFSPGYSSEGVSFGVTCSGSSGAVTFSNLTSTGSDLSAGSNPVGWGISSGTSLVGMKATVACGTGSGLVVGVIASGATQQLTSSVNQSCDSTEVASGSATLTCNIQQVGDPVFAEAWCISTCTITTLTLGSQAFTCPAGATGVSSANTGQGFVCYILSSTSSGSQTVTFTPAGSPSHFQVSVQDVSLGNQTTLAYDTAAVDHCDSSCSEGTTVTTPSITPAATGSLLVNFVYTQHHVTAPGGSWACYGFVLISTDTEACQTVSTVNQPSWISNSAAGSTSANATVLDSNDPFQSIIASFKYTSTAGGGGTTIIPALPLLGVGVGEKTAEPIE